MDLLSALEHFLEEKSDQEASAQAWEARFAEKMREHRYAAGKLVRDVALAACVSPSMIVQMEKGQKRWRLDVARKYLEVCAGEVAAIH